MARLNHYLCYDHCEMTRLGLSLPLSILAQGKRTIWFVVGAVALILGAIGVILPVLPTTPFVILAAFAFGKSVPAWQHWLKQSQTFGPMIADWEAHGAIAPRYKMIAGLMMLATLILSLAMSVSLWIIAIQALCLLGAFTFVVTRPNGPQRPH